MCCLCCILPPPKKSREQIFLIRSSEQVYSSVSSSDTSTWLLLLLYCGLCLPHLSRCIESNKAKEKLDFFTKIKGTRLEKELRKPQNGFKGLSRGIWTENLDRGLLSLWTHERTDVANPFGPGKHAPITCRYLQTTARGPQDSVNNEMRLRNDAEKSSIPQGSTF